MKVSSPRKAARARTASRIRPHVKFWLEQDGRRVFCAGLCQILEAIDSTGSIKEASAVVGRSYRFVWGLLRDAEAALGSPLVESRVGGEGPRRTTLTPRGRKLIAEFHAFRRRLFEFADAEFARRFADLTASAAASR